MMCAIACPYGVRAYPDADNSMNTGNCMDLSLTYYCARHTYSLKDSNTHSLPFSIQTWIVMIILRLPIQIQLHMKTIPYNYADMRTMTVGGKEARARGPTLYRTLRCH